MFKTLLYILAPLIFVLEIVCFKNVYSDLSLIRICCCLTDVILNRKNKIQKTMKMLNVCLNTFPTAHA